MLKRYRKAWSSIVWCGGLSALLALAGCGGGGSKTNVVTVTVIPGASTVIVSQSETLTAAISGTTNTNVQSWACTYAITSTDTTGKPTTGTSTACTTDTGTIPANSTNTTVTFTAPNKVPDLTKLTGGSNCNSSSQSCLLVITITATAAADTKKTGKATISLDSGIAVSVTPATASVPTKESQGFVAALANDLQTQGVTWLITQQLPTSTRPYPSLTTCSPGCGSISNQTINTVLYTAPATVPTATTPASSTTEPTTTTPSTLALVATSKADSTRYTVATITITQGGPIVFKNISPTIAPQGAAYYDIFLDATNISSASEIDIVGNSTGLTKFTSDSGQVKVLFPIATSSNSNPASSGARLRLLASDLARVDTYTVSVVDAAAGVTTCSGSPLPSGCTVAGVFTFNVVPVRPTSVATIPDSIVQNGSTNDFRLTVDGGYFGTPQNPLASVTYQGVPLIYDTSVTSTSRQLNLDFPAATVISSPPGLYPLPVVRSSAQVQPPTNNASVTNLAVFPDYSTNSPTVVGSAVPAGTNPSAVDIDTRLGILVVAESGSGMIESFKIGNGSLSSLGTQAVNTSSGTAGTPTSVSVNQSNHTAAVVDYANQQVEVFQIVPGQGGAPGVTYPLRLSLAGLLPAQPDPTNPKNTIPPARPYSIGVDSDTNMAIVAYSSNANPTTAKVGFLLNLNADGSKSCISIPGATSSSQAPCVRAQVTLNTGLYPQIAMLPHSHFAYVTPGGQGVINGIDVTNSSSFAAIASVSLNSGLVTVTLNLNGQTLALNPGNPGSVLIQGVPPGANNSTNFNGVFTIQSVLSNNSFTYALNSSTNDSATGTSGSNAFFGTPNVTVGFSQTAQGIAINPITRTAAIADANATGANLPQLDFLNSLDQSISSITFSSGCTVFSSTCMNSPELLGTTSVAYQPYSNLVVSYNPNPAQNALQHDQVSISNPVTLRRYAFVSDGSGDATHLGGVGSATITVNGASLNLFGGLAVDPATNQAFVVQSGSSTVRVVNLGPANTNALKPAEITELQVATVAGAQLGGIPGADMPQGTLSCANVANPSGCNLANVQIFGTGFDSKTQVRLDGTEVAGPGVGTINVDASGRFLSFTVPGALLSVPHKYAVDVINGAGSQSNATDFFVITAVDLRGVCTGGNPQPSSVAIADQLFGASQNFAPIAVVSNSGCNNVSVVDIAPQLPVYQNGVLTGFAANADFGAIKTSIATGNDPLGVAVSPRFGLAVVANNSSGSASVLDLLSGTQKVAAVATGTNPTGVAIDEGTGTALITNTGNNTVSELNLALLFGSSPATSLTPTTIAVDQSPIAVAIDPDRGTNNRGLAVVTAVQLVSGGFPNGVLDDIDIGGATPLKSTTAITGGVTATPTGVVLNPCPPAINVITPLTCSGSPALFYATSSGGNVVTTYNPDTGGTSTVHVGINPTSLAINPQTGGIMTINSASKTASIIDTISNPFKTRSTFGLGGSPQFGIAIDQFFNLAVLADQANNRLLIFPLPN